MIKNMGIVDKTIRISIALIIVALYVSDIFNNDVMGSLPVIALVLVTTSLVGFCPLYSLVGIYTNSNKITAIDNKDLNDDL